MRILIVEDDARTANHLKRGLAEAGHVVDCVADGMTAFALAQERVHDAIILDRRLPQMNGIELVTRLRRLGLDIPILMLSAQGGLDDRVQGLAAGCDDYVAKPYAFSEILARIEAITRRAEPARRQSILRVGDLEVDMATRRASRGRRGITLQHRELLILECLMRSAGRVVTRSMLLEAAWNYAFDPRGNVVDMHIHRLRRKIDGTEDTQLIQTVPGAGYTMRR